MNLIRPKLKSNTQKPPACEISSHLVYWGLSYRHPLVQEPGLCSPPFTKITTIPSNTSVWIYPDYNISKLRQRFFNIFIVKLIDCSTLKGEENSSTFFALGSQPLALLVSDASPVWRTRCIGGLTHWRG